jgi:hypothetical protein
VGVPQQVIEGMRHSPSWPGQEALAHTLVYDATVMGDSTLPANLAATVHVSTLILTGSDSGAWADNAARALTAALPSAEHRVLAGQNHAVTWDVLGSALKEYFGRAT